MRAANKVTTNSVTLRSAKSNRYAEDQKPLKKARTTTVIFREGLRRPGSSSELSEAFYDSRSDEGEDKDELVEAAAEEEENLLTSNLLQDPSYDAAGVKPYDLKITEFQRISHAFFDFYFDEDMLSLTTQSSGSYELPELEVTENFFENFDEMPNVKDISSTSSLSLKGERRPTKSTYGHFVNPLTGQEIKSEIELFDDFEQKIKEETCYEETNEIEEILVDNFSLGTIDEMYSVESMPATIEIEKLEVEKAIKLWEEAVRLAKKPVKCIETHIEQYPDPKIIEDTSKFFDDMIKLVIQHTNMRESERLLSQKFDKKKLLRHLVSLLIEANEERYVHSFLDRKASEHYRRKGFLSYLQEFRVEDTVRDYEKYQRIHQRLNELLGEEIAMFKKTQTKIDELEAILENSEQYMKKEREAFEKLMRTALKLEDKPKLAQDVNKGLHEMANLRDAISKVRSILIQRQHTLGRLDQKIDKLQDLGEGLRLSDYENLLVQTTALEKKMEDRIRDLSRSHYSFQNSAHALSHIKMKTEMLYNIVKNQIARYNTLDEELNLCRQYLHSLNIRHVSLSKQLKEMRIRLGLIDKPALLQDYDKTNKLVVEKTTTIKGLWKTRNELESKIKKLQCKVGHQNDFDNNKAAVKGLESLFIVKAVKTDCSNL